MATVVVLRWRRSLLDMTVGAIPTEMTPMLKSIVVPKMCNVRQMHTFFSCHHHLIYILVLGFPLHGSNGENLPHHEREE